MRSSLRRLAVSAAAAAVACGALSAAPASAAPAAADAAPKVGPYQLNFSSSLLYSLVYPDAQAQGVNDWGCVPRAGEHPVVLVDGQPGTGGLDVVLDLALLVDLAFAGEALAYDPRVLFRYRRHDASVSSVQAVDGRRFAEENAFFDGEAQRCAARGWTRAARAARLHVTSRLHHGMARIAGAA